MKTEVIIGFRPTAEAVKSSLPAPLQYLARSIRASTPAHSDRSRAECVVDPQHLDLLIEWGRERVDGQSRIRLLRIEERYGLEDLNSLPAVELLPSQELDDTCFIRNFKTAFKAEWDCRGCNRARWAQISDLQVRPYGRVDCQQTMTDDWIMSGRARAALGAGAFTFRELLGGSNWQQLCVEGRFQLHEEGSSLGASERCSACDQPIFSVRNDLIEGSYIAHSGISIARELPITITLPESPGWSIAASDRVFGNFEHLPSEPRHAVGEPLKLEQMHLGGMYPKRAMIVSIETAQRLSNARITGVAFRPVLFR